MAHLVINAPLKKVELGEDRATVTRVGTLSASALEGRTSCTLEIEAVSPVIVDKTVQCAVTSGAATPSGLRVARRARVETASKPAEIADLEGRIRKKKSDLTLLQRNAETAAGECQGNMATYSLLLDDIARDVSWGRGDAALWAKSFDSAEEATTAALERIFEGAKAKEDLEKEIADLEQQLLVLKTPSTAVHASLLIDLAPCEPADNRARDVDIVLEISYVVPGAGWRPIHTADLSDKMDRVRFSVEGAVWQNTGEDWSDVEAVFSTERPSLGTAAPLLESDVLETTRADRVVHVETREEEIFQCGLGRTETVSELSGIDDGGEAVTLKGLSPLTLLSDGRPGRVPLFSFESEASCSYRLVAEMDESVLLVGRLSNLSAHPILPGPVELIKNRGFIGRTEIKYTAPKERFELGFGPDDSIHVVREKETLPQKERMLSSFTETPYRVRLYIANLVNSPRKIEVTERILVSDIDKVRVTVDAKNTRPLASPDENGFVRWTVDLPPYETKKICLAYEIAKHTDVVGLE